WFDGLGTGSNKREKPVLLALDGPVDGKRVPAKFVFNMQYVVGSAYAYDVERTRGKLHVFKTAEGAIKKEASAEGGDDSLTNVDPVHLIRPTHLVVVNATFPYKEQVDLYQKSLRIASQEELFQMDLQPMIRGINVLRAEVLPGQSGKDLKWEPL